MTRATRNKRKLRIKALHVRLTRYKKTIRMRVLKQAFRDGGVKIYSAELKVDSCAYPELNEDVVWLRGRAKEDDNIVAAIDFGTIKQAKEYYASLVHTFETLRIRYE